MFRLLFLAFLLLNFCSAAQASKRVALVIGNDNYDQISDLQKARNDADAISASLKELGFEVLLAHDVNRREMNQQVQLLASKLNPGDEALFYFAGHGVEIDGRNYLLPTDIPLPDFGQEDYIVSEAVAVDRVLERIRSRQTQVSILILDACRDNPFPRTGTRSLGGTRGLSRSAAPQGTFIMYSAGVGQAALDRLGDNDSNPNSVFTRSLIPMLMTPGLSLVDTARRVRREVQQLASTVSFDQRPAYYDEVVGDFFFSGSQSAPSATSQPANSAAQVWQVIKDTNNPSVLQTFISEFPDTIFAKFARAQLESLNQKEEQKEEKLALGIFPKTEEPENEPSFDRALTVEPPNPQPVNLSQSYDWDMVTSFPRDMPHLDPAIKRFAKKLTELTGEKVKTNIFSAGEKIGAFEVFDEVASGNSNMGWSFIYYWKGKNKAFSIMTEKPFGFEPEEMLAWRLKPEVKRFVDRVSAEFNLRILPCGLIGRPADFWSNKKIETVADLKNFKVRFPGNQGDLMARLGGKPISLPGGQIYENLVSGAIDAVNWVNPQLDYYMRFFEASKYYYYPGFIESGAVADLMINLDVWNQLSAELQQTMEQLCIHNALEDLKVAEREDKLRLAEIRKQGIVIEPLPLDVRRVILSNWEDLAEEMSRDSPDFAELYKLYEPYGGGTLSRQSR